MKNKKDQRFFCPSFFPKTRNGYMFTLDAFFALVIILGVVLFIKPPLKQVTYEESIQEDLISTLSSISIGEIDDNYARAKISTNEITNLNQSVLDQIGEFYANGKLVEARALALNILNPLDINKNFGLYFDDEEIYSNGTLSQSNAESIVTSRQIISGIQNGTSAKGFSARAFLFSDKLVDYFYFGGYIGDGNITVNLGKKVISAGIEGAFSGPFSLYINNQFVGDYSPIKDVPYKISLAGNESKFVTGDNNLSFISSTNLYIAGGYVRVTYDDTELPSKNGKDYFPGIDGFINLYQGFYVPSNIDSLEILLHFNSTYDIFLALGNSTIYEGNSGGQEVSMVFDDRTIMETLRIDDYSQFQNKTVPLRLGLSNASYSQNVTVPTNVISVDDISGSMFGQRLTDAKNANIVLIDTILNYSGNKVGLAAYATWAKKNDFHPLSNDSTSLKDEVNSWNAQDYTCICCGILKAVSCFDKNIFLDNFNGQNEGSNPIGWTLTEGNGAIDITSSSLEGNRAVNIARLGSQNPLMSHYFPPQQDKITTEFLVRHSSGNGRVRIEIEGANDGYSFFQDYIIIKMYSGWIRNNDAQVVSYNLNAVYKIKIEAVPGQNTYDLYVDDLLVGNDLPVYSTRNNVARVLFTTESSNINYTTDDVKVFLTDEICEAPSENKNRVAVVMSDGQGNRACGLDPVPDYDQDGDITDDPSDHAIEAACIAKQEHNITVHAVGFGNTADESTLQKIALQCGGGSYYFADIGGLVYLYSQIAEDIISASYVEQTITGIGFSTKLFPDSYILIDYDLETPYGLLIATETNDFGNNISVGNFSIPQDSIPYEAKVVSYSGSKWTSRVEIYDDATSSWSDIFNLDEYATNFTKLGDPYFVHIPKHQIKYGNNTVRVRTGVTSGNYTGGSNYDKVIFSVIKNLSAYSPILSNADGCVWNIEFEDGSYSSLTIPQNYSGSSLCYYNSSISSPSHADFPGNDAINQAVANLFYGLDLNLNGKIETKLGTRDFVVDSLQIEGIPYTWETEVQTRVWR